MSCCAHCGRTDTIMGHLSCGMVSVGLCQAEPDGDRADPDCYHLVSVWGEKLGSRISRATP